MTTSQQLKTTFSKFEQLKSAHHIAKTALLLLCFVFIGVQAQAQFTGSGTSEDPYQVSTAADMELIASNVNTGTTYSGVYFKLMNDISLAAYTNWDPIGNNWNVFMGKFNGNSNKISGLTINSINDYCGLFGNVGSGCVIRNLTIENCNITTTGSIVGALVGNLKLDTPNQNITIDNCHSSGSITGLSGIGGLIGLAVQNSSATGGDLYSVIISNSSSSATVVITHTYGGTAGGLIGDLSGTITMYSPMEMTPILIQLKKCYATGSVSGHNELVILGGLVGQTNWALISNCYATGSVASNHYQSSVGGLLGSISNSTMSNCYSTGFINASGYWVHAFIGGTSYGTITNCFWDTETSKQSADALATGKTTTEMKTLSTFTDAGWNFSSPTPIWKMDATINNGYPYLTRQASGLVFTSVKPSQLTIGWTNGNATKRAVFVKAANTGTATPLDNTTYTGNTTFSIGTQIGSTGWYCVYNGTESSVTVTGLTAETEYIAQVFEYDGTTGAEKYYVDTATDNPKSQKTALGAPIVTTQVATNVTNAGATLNGSVNANNFSTTVAFEYGTTTAYGSIATATQSPVTGTTATAVSAALTGLPSNTTYHYRVKATSSAGTTYGENQTFTTSKRPMVLTFNTALGSDNTITLPFMTNVNVTVDWGDGTSSNITSIGYHPHTYSTSGTYTVSISGSLKAYGFGGSVTYNAEKLVSVSDFGDLGLESLSGAFSYAVNLTSLPATLPSTVKNLSYLFSYITTTLKVDLSGWNTSNVTNMANMFMGCTNFNQNIGINGWNTSSVTNMADMFWNCNVFNQNIGDWDTKSVTNMTNMFTLCKAFNQDISKWNTGAVTDMKAMLNSCEVFNQDIGDWNVSNVENMNAMFSFAYAFNQDLSKWNVSKVTNMEGMFRGASIFNKDIGNWNVGNVTNMRSMFSNCSKFNQNLGNWDIINVTDMTNMFYHVTLSTANYNALLTGWAGKTVQQNVTFHGGNSKYNSGTPAAARLTLENAPNSWRITDGGQVPNPPTATTQAATNVFSNYATINGLVAANNSSTTVTFEYGTTTAYGSTITANPSPVTGDASTAVSCKISGLSENTTYHYRVKAINAGGTVYGEDMTFTTHKRPMVLTFNTTLGTDNTITLPLVGLVTGGVNVIVDWGDGNSDTFTSSGNRSHTYGTAGTYTVRICGTLKQYGFGGTAGNTNVNLVSVTDFGDLGLVSLSGAFRDTKNLTTLPATLPSTVTNISYLFYNATTFNIDISNWNTENVTNMSYMFLNCKSFNQDIGLWKTGNVTDMNSMFWECIVFNKNIGGWDTKSVTNMNYMFFNCRAFNQNIGTWNIGAATNMYGMLQGITLSTANYNALLTGWAGKTVQQNVTFHGGSSKYNSGEPAIAKAKLIDTYKWKITDGGLLTIAPTATTVAASAVTNNEATLNANVNANGFSTTVTFEYGTTTAYGSTITAIQSPVAGTTATTASATLNNLAENTTYHYRVKAANAGGTTYGTDQTFTTLKTTPTISEFTPALGIVGSAITITGTNFSTTIAENEVYVGTVKATITDATATTLTFTIPSGAATGKIKVVLNNGQEAISEEDLIVVISPTFTSSAPVATIGYKEQFNYIATITTGGDETTNITLPTKPTWLTQTGDFVSKPKAFVTIPSNSNLVCVTTDNEGNTYSITFDAKDEQIPLTIYKTTTDGTTTTWKENLLKGLVLQLHISDGYIYIPRLGDKIYSVTRIPLANPAADEEIFASLKIGAAGLAEKDGYMYASDYFAEEIVKINKLSGDTTVILNSADGIPEEGVIGLSFDTSGNLLIPTYSNKSILKYDGINLTTLISNLPGAVTALKVDKQNDIYVAFESEGLRRYKPDFSTYELVSANEDDEVWGVDITESGAVLYSTMSNIIYKLNPSVTLQGTPGKSNIGPNNVVIRATNSAGYTEQAFTINVVDNVSPVISAFSPATSTIDVALQPTLSMTFDEEVSLGTSGILGIYDGATLVKSYDLSVPADRALFELSTDKMTVSITLTEDLTANTAYGIGLGAGFVKDIYDNGFAGFKVAANLWQFTTINKVAQTITYPEITAKTYGAAAFTLGDATTDKGLTITYTAEDPMVVNIVGNQANILKAGETKITATQNGNNSTFAASAVERTLTVNKAPLTITAENKSKIYDGQVHTDFTVAYTGFVKNETAAALTGTLAFEGTATTATNVGTDYIVTPKGFTSNNYNITFGNGKFEISQRPITITADPKSKTYGDVDPTLTAQVSSGTIVSGDAASGTLKRAAGENVNTYAIAKDSYTFGANYSETFVPANLTISQRPITITADPKSKTYGDVDPTLTAQVTSGTIVSGDAASGTLKRAAGENVNTYAIAKDSYTYGANYSETFVPANLTISQRPITITADPKSKTYGDADPTLTAQVSSGTIVSGDAASGTLIRAAGENVNTYAINQNDYSFGANYSETFVPANLTITQRPITITANPKSKTYGDVDPTLTAQVTSGTIVSGDAASGTLKRAAGENVNTYAIAKDSYTFGANYSETFVPANLTITQRAITITADPKSKTYGDANPTLTAQVTSGTIVSGDAASGTLKRAAGENVNIYAIAKDSYTYGANYSETFVPANLTITQRPITITADPKSKTYGDADPTLTAQVTSGTIVSGDAASGTLKRAAGENVNTYAINQNDYSFGANYSETFVPANLTISQRALSVTAIATSKIYDCSTICLGKPTVGTLASGDVVNNAATQVYDNINVGSSHILLASGLTIKSSNDTDATDNYNITYIPSSPTGVILAKQLTISEPVVVSNKMFDGTTTASITNIGNLLGVEMLDETNVNVSAEATYNSASIGSDKVITVRYTLTGTAASNYLAPANYEIANAKIAGEITLSPLTSPNADCEASALDLEYSVLTGVPTKYKLTFSDEAIAAGMVNVAYTQLNTNTEKGSISFDISAVEKGGTYRGTLVMSDDNGVESVGYNFNFSINVSADLIMQKFTNVIFVDNKVNGAVGFQWYKNGIEIPGATKQFYMDPAGLVGVYAVRLTTPAGEHVNSCDKVLNIPLSKKVHAYPNPVKANQDCRVDVLGFSDRDFENAQLRIYNAQGAKVYETLEVNISNPVYLPSMPGVYVGQFSTTNGETYTFKIIVPE